ncbi:MAG: glycerol-3-phosphate dehydrogenase C-terminal domain-containing protein, partial [Candidatus Binataceae bacterium]
PPDGDDASRWFAALTELAPDARDILTARYGTRAALIASLISERPDLARPLGQRCPVIGAEVIYAIRYEMAHALADFMVRRTGLIWRCPAEAASAAVEVSRLMAAELGWPTARADAEVAMFRDDLARRRGA